MKPVTAPSRPRRLRWAAFALLAAALVYAADRAHAQLPVYFDDEVKAAFLYHFGTYTEWPGAPGRVTRIAVLGREPIVGQLERYLPGKTMRGRPVQVRAIDRIDELDGEEILFIGASRNADLERIIAEVGMRPVLVVTDSPSGLGAGAAINFRIVDDRVRFEISLSAAENAGLRLSSRLLTAAFRVERSD